MHTSVYVVDLCVCIYLYMWREINVSPPATHICKERSIDLTYPSHTHTDKSVHGQFDFRPAYHGPRFHCRRTAQCTHAQARATTETTCLALCSAAARTVLPFGYNPSFAEGLHPDIHIHINAYIYTCVCTYIYVCLRVHKNAYSHIRIAYVTLLPQRRPTVEVPV